MRAGALVLIGLALASVVEAAPLRLRIDNTATLQGFVATDDVSGDLASPGLGTIVVSSAIPGGFVINVATGLSDPPVNLPNSAAGALQLQGTTVLAPGPGSIRFIIENPGYAANPDVYGVNGFVSGNLSAPAGSTITVQSYINTANLVPVLGADGSGLKPAIAIPPGSRPVFNNGAGFVAGPGLFSGSDFTAGLGVAGGPYSLFTEVVVNFTGAGSANFDVLAVAAVPEPGSLLLLGLGLAGLGARLRRRERPAAQA